MLPDTYINAEDPPYNLVPGAAVDQATATSNVTAFQAARDAAAASGKVLYLPSAQYQFYGPLVLANASKTYVHGRSGMTILEQTQAVTDAFHMGPVAFGVVANSVIGECEIKNLRLRYSSGAMTTSLSSGSRLCSVTAVILSRFENLYFGYTDQNGTYAPMRVGFTTDDTSGTQSCYSNAYENMWAKGFTEVGMKFVSAGGDSGNTWDRIFVSNGEATGATSGNVNPCNQGVTFQGTQGRVGILNIEWMKAAAPRYILNCRALVFEQVHIEGVQPAYYQDNRNSFTLLYSTSSVTDVAMQILNCQLRQDNHVVDAGVYQLENAVHVRCGSLEIESITKQGTAKFHYAISSSKDGNSDIRARLPDLLTLWPDASGTASRLDSFTDQLLMTAASPLVIPVSGHAELCGDGQFALPDADTSIYWGAGASTYRTPTASAAARTFVLERTFRSGLATVNPREARLQILNPAGAGATHTIQARTNTGSVATLATLAPGVGLDFIMSPASGQFVRLGT